MWVSALVGFLLVPISLSDINLVRLANWNKCFVGKTHVSQKDISFKQCHLQCQYRRLCKAANYWKKKKLCELLITDDVIQLQLVDSQEPCVSIERSDLPEIDSCSNCGNETVCVPANNNCVIRDCQSLTVNRGNVEGNLRHVGARIKVVCTGIYQPDPLDSQPQCQADGNWDIVPECVCQDGLYGNNCIQLCGNCLNGEACDKEIGTCPSGCAAGRQGDTCKTHCSDGFYGNNCVQSCGNCIGGAACDKYTGVCSSGCTAGWKDAACKTPCSDGFYGNDCIQSCGNCLVGEVCDRHTGACPSSCTAGWQGVNCKTLCSDGLYGNDCIQPCGNCLGGEVCDKHTGICPTRCVYGWQHVTCKADCPMFFALVTGPNGISDSHINASSEYDNDYLSRYGRLNNSKTWASEHDEMDEYIQFDFTSERTVGEIITQGSGSDAYAEWVKTYKLHYSTDCESFTEYDQVFVGNDNEDTCVNNVINPPIFARCVRVNPQSWHVWISMRVELIGC